MRTDRRGQLCACEYRRLKKKKTMQLFVSMEWMTANGYWWWIFAHPCLFLQDCLQRTRTASRNIVRSAFHSSGPLLKSDEGKILFYFNIVCLFCFVLFAFATPQRSQNRYFTITDLNCLLRLQYLLKTLGSCSERFSCSDPCIGWFKGFPC